MKTSTIPVPQNAAWRVIDAEGQNLGRMAVKIACSLLGKDKATFSPHQMCGDHVIVLNAGKVLLPPKKSLRKVYYRHTGHPGGLKTTSLEDMIEKKPEEVIHRAVKGMMPLNRMRTTLLKRLHIFTTGEHPYAAQKPTPLSL